MRYIISLTKACGFIVLKIPLIMIVLALWLALGDSVSRHGLGDLWSVSIAVLAVMGLGAFAIRYIRKCQKPFGNATFASSLAIERARLRWHGRILGLKNRRFIRFDRPGHLLTFAPTRSGKGVGVVIPNLLDHPGSVVVTDIKGENYRITANHRRKLGPVWAFAPFDDDFESACFNPIDFIRTGTDYDVDDARLIAEMIVAPVYKEPDHWEREARALVMGLLLFIATDLPQGRRNLRELRSLLMRDREGFQATLQAMAESKHPVVARTAKGFSQKEDKERSAVVSTAQGNTEAFDSPQISAITSKSTFRLEDLKDQVASLYLIVPPEYVASYQPFLRLVVGLTCAAMTRNRRLPRHQVLFLLDELPALGNMTPIENGIGYLAGYGVSLWLFVQDLDQLQQTYRKWRSMIANCAVRQAFNIQDPETAKLLSEMLGQRTVKTHSTGKSGRFAWLGLPSGVNESEGETGRPLLAPDEIMRLPEEALLLFVQGCRPILGRKVRYFEDRRFKRKATKWKMGEEEKSQDDLLALISKGS